MKKSLLFIFLIASSFYSWASFTTYFPKNITSGNAELFHKQTLLDTDSVKLDSNGYVLLLNSNGIFLELMKSGTYNLADELKKINPSDISVSRKYVDGLKEFLDLNPQKVEYNKLGSVSYRPIVYTKPLLIFAPSDIIWYQSIPLNIYFQVNGDIENTSVELNNMFYEPLKKLSIDINRVYLDSDTLFERLINLEEVVTFNETVIFNTTPPLYSYSHKTSLHLKTDSTLSMAYSDINKTNYSSFIKQLLKMTFFEKNKMITYHLSSLIEANSYVISHPKLEENLTLMSCQYAKYYKFIYSKLTEKKKP